MRETATIRCGWDADVALGLCDGEKRGVWRDEWMGRRTGAAAGRSSRQGRGDQCVCGGQEVLLYNQSFDEAGRGRDGSC